MRKVEDLPELNKKLIPVNENIEMDITDDMYVGTCSEDVVETFTCMLCYGIVDKPLKCDKCETVYCSKCIPKRMQAPG